MSASHRFEKQLIISGSSRDCARCPASSSDLERHSLGIGTGRHLRMVARGTFGRTTPGVGPVLDPRTVFPNGVRSLNSPGRISFRLSSRSRALLLEPVASLQTTCK